MEVIEYYSKSLIFINLLDNSELFFLISWKKFQAKTTTVLFLAGTLISSPETNSKLNLELINILGKPIFKKELYEIEKEGKVNFNELDLTSGLYFLKISNEYFQETISLIIQ